MIVNSTLFLYLYKTQLYYKNYVVQKNDKLSNFDYTRSSEECFKKAKLNILQDITWNVKSFLCFNKTFILFIIFQ